MRLFNQLDAKQKSAEENWNTLNALERKITVRRIDATVTLLVGISAFYLYAIAAIYALLASGFLSALLTIDGAEEALAGWSVKSLFDLLPLPWYATILVVAAGLFVIPWVLAAIAKGLTLLITRFAVREKTAPLPTDPIEQARALAQRTKKLYHAQYHSTGPNTSVWPNYIASFLFGATPIAVLLCVPETRGLLAAIIANSFGDMPQALGWVIVVAIMIVIMLIPGFIFSFAFMTLELAFDEILHPLHWGRHWHPRCRVLDDNEKVFYERWIAVDPEERQKDDQRKALEAERWEQEKRRKEEFTRTMAAAYAREQKEHQEYLDRLHKWATEDDGIDWKGKGDGI